MDKRTLRSKKVRPRNARQYDRPNQGGLFNKVCSTVKGILQPTSWMFNSLTSWMSSSTESQPETSLDIENETIREDNDIVSQSVSHGNKRLRLRFEDDNPSIQNSGTQTWPDPSSQNLYNTIAHTQSSSAQTSILENKESIAVLNGDDHSENSEGSASTSGCSSLVSSHKDINRVVDSPFHSLRSELKNSRKRKEPSTKSELDDLSSSRTLWSSSFSPSSKFQRRLPTISHTNQPSFNLSTFVGPSKLNESIERKISSPFYEGKTTFGGASASRRMPPSVAPYQVSKTLRNQIKVREHNSEDNLESMSSAAKRILMTLEKMSTPVADAKKIPNSKTSPVDLSVYLTPPKSRRNSQFTPTVSSKGPPIANINTIAKLATLKNYGVNRLRTTLPSSPVTSVGQESFNYDNAQSHSSPETILLKSGGGKIKNKLNQHHLSSKDPNGGNELPQIPDLPNVPLPISKLPTINFGSKVEKPKDSNPPMKSFTFSNPIEHDLSLNNAVSTSFAPKPFVFSSPIEHELPNNNSLPKENTLLPVSSCNMSGVSSSAATWECNACWVRNAVGRTSCIACETPKISKENHSEEAKSQPSVSSVSASSTTAFTFATPASSSSPAFTFGTKTKKFFKSADSNAATWECASCWVRNPEKESKCMACETPRSKKDNLSSKEPESKSVSTNSATWECSACWVKNPAKESKCLACESPRSSKEELKSSKSSSVAEWECSSCWVRNPTTESKCRACEIPRVSEEKTEAKSTNSNAFSTWECTSCWVRNPMKEKKCMACETLHPSADETSGTKDVSGFKFSSPIQNSPITFKFGNYVCTAPSTATTSSFKFGVAVSEPLSTSTTTSSSGFKFGSSTVAATSSFFSTPAFTADSSQISKNLNVTSSTKVNYDTVTENKAVNDKNAENEKSKDDKNTMNESSRDDIKDTEKEVSSVNTSKKIPESSGVSSETNNVLLVNKNSENKVSDSVITTSTETPVSKAKEVATPSVTACFSFTTQPLLDSKKTDTFPFAVPKGKLNSQPASSPFGVFPSNTEKLNADEKSMQSSTKNVNTENKFPTSFQFTNQSQPVSSAFTALASAPVFKFGEKSDSPKMNSNTTSTTATTNSFSFTNNTSNYSTLAVSKGNETSTTSEIVSPSTKADDTKVSSSVAFSSTITTASSFVFGNTVTTSAPSGGFSFFPPSSTSTAASSVFTFGVSSNTAQSSKPSGFTFKGIENTQSVSSVTTATPITSTSQSTASVLSNIGSTATVPTGGFVFGAPKTEAQTTAAAPFAFGSGAVSSSSTPAFSAFQASQPATTFQFGSQPAGSTAPTIGSSGSFAFAKSEISNQVPSSASQNPAPAFGSSTTNFVFGGAKSETPNQITSSVSQAPSLGFGSSTSSFSFSNKTENSNTISQNPNPAFGTSMPSGFANPAPPPFGGADKPPFNFGGASTSGVFQFGAPSNNNNNNNNNNNTERKRTATASGFSFGTPTASGTTNSFPGNFNMNTPPSFNFGATSTPAGPALFQFAASSAPKTAAAQTPPRKIRKAVRRVRN